jgi:hypothetical protein
MKVTTTSVTYGRKFNLGDFNSAHIEISIWAELEEGDDPETVRKQLWEEAKASVKDQALPLYRKQQARAAEVFAGLPVELQEEILHAHQGND